MLSLSARTKRLESRPRTVRIREKLPNSRTSVVASGYVATGEKVIVVTGTGRGADTAIVAIAAPSTKLSDLHVTEIICKPLETKSWPTGTKPPAGIVKPDSGSQRI